MVSCGHGRHRDGERIQAKRAITVHHLNGRRQAHLRMNLGCLIARQIGTGIDHLEIRSAQIDRIGNYVDRHSSSELGNAFHVSGVMAAHEP
jgi:hypothetical protein